MEASTVRRLKAAPSLRILAWLALTVTLWALLSGNSGWYIGIPVVVIATSLAAILDTRPWTVRPLYVPSFSLFFITHSLLGGWDVARRAISRKVPLAPGWVQYELRADDPAVHLALSAIIGLLPGTLASHYDATHLHVHLLDVESDWRPTAQRLEQHLMRVTGTRERS